MCRVEYGRLVDDNMAGGLLCGLITHTYTLKHTHTNTEMHTHTGIERERENKC